MLTILRVLTCCFALSVDNTPETLHFKLYTTVLRACFRFEQIDRINRIIDFCKPHLGTLLRQTRTNDNRPAED